MNGRISYIFRRTFAVVINATIGRIVGHRRRSHTPDQSANTSDFQDQDEHAVGDVVIPALSRSDIKRYERAILVDSNSNTFGDTCLRLVNIAFHTGQTFPALMNTCSAISRYIRKELMEQYFGEYFHIIISENHAFGFAITDDNYFAEIEQEQYRVLIFATNRNRKVSYGKHDANSQMILEWESPLIEPLSTSTLHA